jgi:phosphoglycolate phosphatase
MKYKGVIFDLDGTLADTLEDIAGSMNRVLHAHGYPARPVNDYKLLVGRGLDNLVALSLPVDVRLPENINQCHQEMIADYTVNCLVKTHLYEGISEMLNELVKHGIPVAVFSNKAEPLTIRIVNALMGNIPFLKVTGARSDLPKKPDPSGALDTAVLMKLPARELVYVGDSDVDMMTANRAGMFAVGVLWGFRSKEELQANGARALLSHPRELVGILL